MNATETADQPRPAPAGARASRWRKRAWSALAALGLVALAPSVYVYAVGKRLVVAEESAAKADTILVLGAKVYPGGRPSDVLRDRLDTALRLYQRGVASRIVVSGDHEEPGYDEPGAMAAWLVAHGVPKAAIVEDGLGLDTYSSMARAKGTYGVARVVVVTQAFHLPRALYLAQAKGLACEGVVADARRYRKAGYYQIREGASRVRAFLDVARDRRVPLNP